MRLHAGIVAGALTPITLMQNATAFWHLGEVLTVSPLTDATGRGNDLTPYLRPAVSSVAFRMGQNYAGNNTQQLHGALAGWGKWNRLLTSGEKSALAGGEMWPFSTTTTLQDAKAYFLLNEAAGSSTYADATGRGNDLTAHGTTTQVTGPLGVGHGVGIDTGVYLDKSPVTADLQTGNITCTICGWVLLTSSNVGTQQIFWGQLDQRQEVDSSGAAANCGTNLYYAADAAGNTFCTDHGNGDLDVNGANAGTTNTVFGAASLNTWYFMMFEYDASGNIINNTINNVSQVTLSPIQQPLSVPGQIGNASQFQGTLPVFAFGVRNGWDQGTAAGPAYHAQNVDLSFGNNAKTVWGWVKVTTPGGATQTILGFIDETSPGPVDWIVQISANQFYFVTGNSTGSVAFCTVPLADSNWHLFVCWFDKVGGKIHIDLDHGAHTANASVGFTPSAISRQFLMGVDYRNDPGFGSQVFEGSLNCVGIANGIPSQADLDGLWNSGAGVGFF